MSAATRRTGLGLLCCARKVNGHAVADPTIALTKSRRRIAFTKARDYAEWDAITAGICDTRNGVQGRKLHSSNFEPLMFALGHKRTWQRILLISALPPRAD